MLCSKQLKKERMMNFDLMSIVPVMVMMSWMNQNGYTLRLDNTIDSARQWVWNTWSFHPDVQSFKKMVSQNGNIVGRRATEMTEWTWERVNHMTDFEFNILLGILVFSMYGMMFAYYLTHNAKKYADAAETEKAAATLEHAAKEYIAKERRMWQHMDFMEPGTNRRRPITRSQMLQPM